MVTGDVPAAPTVFERGGGIDHGAALAHERVAIAAGKDGADKNTWNIWGEGAAVATEAALIACKVEGLIRWGVWLKQIKDGSEQRIDGRDFDGAADAVTDVGVVAKVDDAWGLRVDEVVLFAGFGKDQDLGGLWDVEVLHQGAQDGPGVGAIDLDFA